MKCVTGKETWQVSIFIVSVFLIFRKRHKYRKAQNYMDIHFEELLRKEIPTAQSRRRILPGFRPSMGFSFIKKTSVLPFVTTVLNILTINSLFSKSWRRERLPTPVCWPRESHGLYSPSGRKESNMTERLSLHFTF